MRPFVVRPISHLEGEVFLPGDKSIAHRAIILSALAVGKTRIENFPRNADCLSTVKFLQNLGIKIKERRAQTTVSGKGLRGLKKPAGTLCVGNSGTTLRLALGILAGQNFKARLIAGKTLLRRPMLRVNAPLRKMGARIKARRKARGAQAEEYPPVTIQGLGLKPISYKMPLASAQVKSAILLAGLFAEGVTRVIEPIPTRDHTERMLKLFKADVKVKGKTITVKGRGPLSSPLKIYIPGDISSAAFFIVAAILVSRAELMLRRVCLNPSRTGMLKVLKRMGADISVHSPQSTVHSYEPMGDIMVKSGKLKGTLVKREEIPSLIDELPILMLAASVAEGKTVFEGIEELRVKETDRINSMSENLRKMGAKIRVISSSRGEDMLISGVKQLAGARVRSFSDHRTAMSMVIAGLAASGRTSIDDVSCIDKSFPGFLRTLKRLTA